MSKPNPYDLVRVKHTVTRHEYSVPRSAADADQNLTILADKDATDSNGAPLGPKHHRDLNPNRNTQPEQPEQPAGDPTIPAADPNADPNLTQEV